MIVPATNARLIVTTAGSRGEAERIARTLVEERLAACVNLLPGLVSVYRWQGEIENADEVLLLIKTTVQHLEKVETVVRGLHSYDVPELLVLHLEGASQPYLEWLLQSTALPH